MANFDYLRDIESLKDLYAYCSSAENYQQNHPELSALESRKALEWVVRAIYELKHIEVSDRSSLYTLIDGEPFQSFISSERMMMAVHYVRKVGNRAAHLGQVTKNEAFFSLLNIYNVVSSILLKLRVIEDFPKFDNSLIPSSSPVQVTATEEVKEPSEDFIQQIDIETVPDEPVTEKETDLTEAQTRKFFIDILLEEAGWNVLTLEGAVSPSKACIEVEVQGMPNHQGTGYADYVLFSASGTPLAVVEAKRTSKDAQVGKHQAELYAECLERQYGVKPVIYYTNGYQTFIIDGLGYPSRQLFGYHTEAELELLIQRRGRADITRLGINDSITNREYQKRAIRTICDRLNKKKRRSLIVMATGTGKTRVAISLTDVLTRNSWVKNVLFLADRTALVRQAAKNFTKLLPSATTCILSDDTEPDLKARIMFSTYQTMIKKIDADSKDFSVGRFDLVIIDEAHRSVFGKYTAIFDYFDAFLVGLTATPREEVDRNTFDLFGTEAEDSFAYELDEAVQDGFLVPYQAYSKSTGILKDGIKYNSLTDAEKESLEAVWDYEKAKKALNPDLPYSRDIGSNEIFSYIFNTDTIDKVLQDLMGNGQRIESGEKIGKTIIFAYNHKHSELIVKRFETLYPEYGSDFCVLIDNTVNYAQDLINKFEVRGSRPQIAVSVDMLDTGIDVPDILNLVFFKPVYSKIKFQQMIGRGTRLSPNIFGIGKDKESFSIFDWCGSFEFFSLNPNGREALPVKSLSEQLFCIRTDLAFELQQAVYQEDTFCKQLHNELKEKLLAEVCKLKDSLISVRQNLSVVDKYRKEENWVYISSVDAAQIKNVISPLVVKSNDDEGAKRFDLLMLHIELSKVNPEHKAGKCIGSVIHIGELLQKKASIPQIKARMSTIKMMSDPKLWETEPSFDSLERIRKEIRELIKFLTGTQTKTFITDIDDLLIDDGKMVSFIPTSYKTRVVDFLAKNRNLPVIEKIYKLRQLTLSDITELERIMWEELGSREEYDRYVSNNNLICGGSVAAFIRSQIGVDRKEALQRFSEFLSGNILNSAQEDLLKTIVSYVSQNGDITRDTIVNVSPFSEFEWSETFGQYFIFIRNYVDELHQVIHLPTVETQRLEARN